MLKRIPRELFAYGAKGVNVLGAFVATMIIARLSGPGTVGEYAIAIQTAQLFCVLALGGYDMLFLRQLAGDVRQGNLAGARGLTRQNFRMLLPRILLVTLGYLGLVLVFEWLHFMNLNMASMLVGGAYMALLTVSVFLIIIIRATGQGIIGQVLDGLQSLLLAFCLGGLFLAAAQPSSTQILCLTVICMALTVGAMMVFAGRHYLRWPQPEHPPERPKFQLALPFLSMSVVMALSAWLPLILVEALMTSTEVGQYRVAFQFALTMNVITITGSNFVGPGIAGDFRIGRLDLAWRRYRRTTIISLILAAPLLVPMLAAPELLIHYTFGPDFMAAAGPLRWLAGGQLVSLAVGPVGILQSMAGKERFALLFGTMALVMMAGLMFLLVPLFGLAGAAAAYASAIALRAVLSFWHARRSIKAVEEG